MDATAAGKRHAIVPKRRQRHYSYNESLDEPGSSLPMSRPRSKTKRRQKRMSR